MNGVEYLLYQKKKYSISLQRLLSDIHRISLLVDANSSGEALEDFHYAQVRSLCIWLMISSAKTRKLAHAEL